MGIDVVDYLLLPLYLFIIRYFIIRIKRKHYADDPAMGKYLVTGCWAKIVGSISFALMMQYYYKEGDSFMYYTGGLDFKKALLSDFPHHLNFLFMPAEDFGRYYEENFDNFHNYGYIASSQNLLAAKFVSLFSVITFNKYILVSLCFGLFSFSGMWQCFKLFYSYFPSLKKWLSIPFLFTPSLLFWGGGILKDPLCIGFLGWLIVSAHLFFIKKQFNIKLLLIILFSFYCLSILKSYVAFAFLPFFILWIFLDFVKSIANPIVRKSIIPLLIAVSVPFLYFKYNLISDYVGATALETFSDFLKETKYLYEITTGEDGAFINMTDIEPTIPGILKQLPISIATTLFRPFLWESKKIITLFSALESAIFLLFTLYVLAKTRVYRFFTIVFKYNILIFCFFFSIFFAGAVGLTCFNFGSLVRYKIPCLPFYIASLIIILHLNNTRNKALLKQG